MSDQLTKFEEIIRKRFSEFGLPLKKDENIVPEDGTTLFVCAGMQNLKPRFRNPDGSRFGNVQSCVRMNDLDLVGDGVHLTNFEMIGSFGFGAQDYKLHIDLWTAIVTDLGIHPVQVHVHPSSGHAGLWSFPVEEDVSCVWSDGDVGGYSSELYQNGLEIGNLVNPLEHSTDVGFGYERLYQIVSGKARVDETDLFRQNLDPVSRDHFRLLNLLFKNGIRPGNKGREYVCRRILRRFIHLNPGTGEFPEFVPPEIERKSKALSKARSYFKRKGKQSEFFWWDTFGILPEEVKEL